MRIALISEHASPLAAHEGQGAYVAHVARCLADDGHSVDVFTRRDDPAQAAVVYLGPRLRVLHVPAGPARRLPPEALLPCMADFAEACIRLCDAGLHYDVVHANFFMSGWVALQLKERLGLPFVMTFHSFALPQRDVLTDDGFPSERLAIERALAREADAIVAECPQVHADLLRLYDADCSKLVLVPCGFDPDTFMPMNRAQARAELELDAKEFIALHLGGLAPDAGIDTAVRAVAQLPPGHAVQLIALADAHDPHPARVRALAASLGASARLQIVDPPAHAARRAWYAAANVVLSLPHRGPSGAAVLEAMACGAPVVGSRVGAIQYAVVDQVTGRLVDPDDVAALAAHLADLIGQPALQRSLGMAGARRAHAMFTWEQVAHQLVTTYRSLPEPRLDAPARPAVPGTRAALVAAK